jgi:hypothetical protein
MFDFSTLLDYKTVNGGVFPTPGGPFNSTEIVMAQPLVLRFGEKELPFQLKKVERSALYGFVDTEVSDGKDRPCRPVTLAGDGRTLVGPGGVALAYMTPDGRWCDKKELKPVDVDGTEITPVPSTFKTPVRLDQTADIDEYLAHNIRLVYQLTSDDEADALQEALGRNTIYTFPFSYRGSLEADTAFLLAGADGTIFMVVGRKADITYVGFGQAADIAPPEEEGGEDEGELDFGMM